MKVSKNISSNLPGINIQAPWARLILDGVKTIETRNYPTPVKYLHQWMWLIETPGKSRVFKSRVIGKVKFSRCKIYKNMSDFHSDFSSHMVDNGNSDFGWCEEKTKWGWEIGGVISCSEFAPPNPRGIVYCRPFSSK